MTGTVGPARPDGSAKPDRPAKPDGSAEPDELGRSGVPSRRRRRVALAAAVMLGLFAVLTVLVVVTAPGGPGLDAEVASWLHRRVLPRPGLASALRLIGAITTPWNLRAVALTGALVLWWSGRGRAALWLIVTMAAGGALGVMLKPVFARDRPQWPDPITVISGYSYPSGHAVNSMLAAACAIVLLDPLLRAGSRIGTGPGTSAAAAGNRSGRSALWLLATVFVLLVGLDRLALGVHFVTDVLAGWTLALATVLATLAAFEPSSLFRPRSSP